MNCCVSMHTTMAPCSLYIRFCQGANHDRAPAQAETDQKKNITAPLVLTLLAISVVVPMLQYWGYTSEVSCPVM